MVVSKIGRVVVVVEYSDLAMVRGASVIAVVALGGEVLLDVDVSSSTREKNHLKL